MRDKGRLYMKRERREESPFGSAGSISQTAAVPKRYTFPLRAYSTAMSVTCIAGALRAQRGERGILNEARSCCLAHRELVM